MIRQESSKRLALLALACFALSQAGCGGDDNAEQRELRQRVTELQAQVAQLQSRVDRLHAQERPYLRAVNRLCNAFRNVEGLEGSEEYATLVGRALAQGVEESCDWANVPRKPGPP